MACLSGARVPKQQRSRETQQSILDTALTVFSERGVEGTSMSLIAERAGVGQPLLVYHFPSKEDLWVATVKSALGRFLEHMRPNFEALQGLDPAIRLRLIFQDFTRFSAATPELLKVLIDANRRGGPSLAKVVEDQLRPTYERMLGLIEAAQAAGAVPTGDPALIYYAMVAVGCTLFSLNREFELLTSRDPREPEIVEAQATILARLFFPGVAHEDRVGGQ
jgi:TetR/AcrR family transcriptional regulator